MRDAVIVSTARTPIGRAYRGAFNATPSPTLAAHAIRAAVARARVGPREIDDVLIGAALPQGCQALIGRTAAMRAGLPVDIAGMSIDRESSSGLMAIATAAKQVIIDRMNVVVAGGVESVSLVETKELRIDEDPELQAMLPTIYLPMLEAAEAMARRYKISREAQDAFALQSQKRTAAAQARGAFSDEIIAVEATMSVKSKQSDATTMRLVRLSKDEAVRAEVTAAELAALPPIMKGGVITTGNAAPPADGAAALVVMEAGQAAKRKLSPLGRYVGMAVAGTEPDDAGIGPIHAVSKLLKGFDLKMRDIGLWEISEAFAVQTVCCRDRMGISDELLNVNGGAISIGNPYGMSGARMVSHALIEGKSRAARYVVVAMSIRSGMGAAALFEVL